MFKDLWKALRRGGWRTGVCQVDWLNAGGTRERYSGRNCIILHGATAVGREFLVYGRESVKYAAERERGGKGGGAPSNS